MNRPAAEAKTLQRIRDWRAAVPELTIRSSFIVGFPGETERDFDIPARVARGSAARPRRLLPLRARARRARQYAAGTPFPSEVNEERWHRFMAAQQTISARRLQMRVGGKVDVIVDEVDDEQALGRSAGDAPEIDGRVYLGRGKKLKPGDLVEARVTAADEYDLWADPVIAR